MVFATAKYWGLLPHVLWRFPFRYYRELRDFYIASLLSPASRDDASQQFDFDAESLRGEAI